MWWVLGALVPLTLFFGDWRLFDRGHVAGGGYWGRDFVNLWTAGQLIRAGELRIIYDIPAYQAFQAGLFGPLDPHNYSYPPVTFPVAALFSFLPYPLALAAWVGGTGVFFAHACRRWWPADLGPHWLAVLTPAALLNTWAGHYGFLLGGLFLLGWQRLDRHPVQAGVLFGCMLMKPHLAAMIAVALLARREWKAVAAGIATVAVLVAATSLAFGWQYWPLFLFDVGSVQSAMIDADGRFFGLMSTSLATGVLRLVPGPSVATAAQGFAGLAAVLLVLMAARRPHRTRDLALLAATCTFVALPYAFNYDLTAVMVAAVVLMVEARHRWQRLAAGMAFIAPGLGMAAAYASVPLLPLSLIALAAAQWWQMRRSSLPAGSATATAFNRQSAAWG
uniref:glycosyltransferase family 87 protein n=1 Tax=uncultured Sphingomonas sp. TaxID=158754 RepID=UPI0025FB3EFF|nr:glycosyltransferase family 87 protein [uncultured Sphingomonas sp.]